jgi:hypothetical protein
VFAVREMPHSVSVDLRIVGYAVWLLDVHGEIWFLSLAVSFIVSIGIAIEVVIVEAVATQIVVIKVVVAVVVVVVVEIVIAKAGFVESVRSKVGYGSTNVVVTVVVVVVVVTVVVVTVVVIEVWIGVIYEIDVVIQPTRRLETTALEIAISVAVMVSVSLPLRLFPKPSDVVSVPFFNWYRLRC